MVFQKNNKKIINAWCIYDWSNSVYSLVITSAIFPIYFQNITTSKDPYAKKTVLDLIEGACKERVYPVGRLDRNTTGVLLLTNDGELTKKLTHPSSQHKKIYHVTLDKKLKQTDFNAILEGLELEDGFIKLRDKVVAITPEIVDDLIEGINCLKKWLAKREKMFKEKKEGFTDAISEEKKEFDILINRIEKNMGGGTKSSTSEKSIKQEKAKKEESVKTVSKPKEEDIFRFEIYFDETAPMFEVKRTIIPVSYTHLTLPTIYSV